MFVDSHCHINLLGEPSEIFSIEKIDPYIVAAKTAGIERLLCIAIDCDPIAAKNMQDLAAAYPELIWLSAGLHPNDVPKASDLGSASDTQDIIYKILSEQAAHPAVVAIGETGLDCYRHPEDLSTQIDYFKLQIQLSQKLNKPLIIHTRAARMETIQVLKSESKKSPVRGVLHCFTETWEMAQQALDLGLYISFSGILTFPKTHELKLIAQKMPLDRILIETDAPFLAPVPYRGKLNQPAWVVEIAKCLATLRQEPLSKIAEQTTANFYRLFQPTAI